MEVDILCLPEKDDPYVSCTNSSLLICISPQELSRYTKSVYMVNSEIMFKDLEKSFFK